MNSREYWKNHYEDVASVSTGNLQQNVGRTVGGLPISPEVWQRTVDHIIKLIDLQPEFDILELCCGNGRLIGPLSARCRSASGVDFSGGLLNQLTAEFGRSVKIYQTDALEFDRESASVDVVLIYFSIQHFTESETLLLISRCLQWLRPLGVLLIGDVPDHGQKWAYINDQKSRADYLQRALVGRPLIGQWFDRQFFEAMNDFFAGATFRVLDQPDDHFNSHFRFDVLINKVEA